MATKFNSFNSQEKILHYSDKLHLFLNAHKTLIVTEFDLTNRCNNRCPNCIGINGNNAELTWDEIQEIVRSLREMGNQGVIVSGGGEPLLHKDFIRTLKLIKESGMKIGVNSNGLALDEKKAHAIAEYCEYFRISLDAGSPEMYQATHGMNSESFYQVLRNIKMMMEIKKETGSEVSFTVGFLTGKETLQDMEAFVVLSKENGADAAQFRPFQDDSTDIRSEYRRLKQKYETDSFKVLCSLQKYEKFDQAFVREYKRCHGMFFSTVITADAKMFACLHHRQDDKFLICDMRKGESLIDMWNYRKWIIYHDMDLSDCPAYCRNDSFNCLLDSLLCDVPHKEFM